MSQRKTDECRRKAFSLLVDQHREALLKTCYLYLHDLSLAEDAVQETFIKAYQKYQYFRGDSKEKTWLIRIAINTCKDINRSAWYKYVNRFITPEMLPSACESFEQSDEELLLVLINLPLKLREVVLLYFYHDLTLKEIASLLHITSPAVSSRLSRAKRIIRSSLEGREENE